MGASQPKSPSVNSSIEISHPAFMNSTWNQTQNTKLIENKMSLDETNYGQWKQTLKNSNLSSEFILLPKSDLFTSKGFCGSSGLLTLRYQNFPYLLKEEITKRSNQKEKFEESDLWFLIYCLTMAEHQIWTKAAQRLGDVRPRNIFINEDGEIKASCCLSWPGETKNSQKALERQVTYLSPQQIIRLSSNLHENKEDINSDIFSIGVTLLSSGLLVDGENLYNLENGIHSLDQTVFRSYLDEWKQSETYSVVFRSLVCNLCNVQADARLTIFQLWELMKNYQQSIINKETFVISNAPEKLHHSVAVVNSWLAQNHHQSSLQYKITTSPTSKIHYTKVPSSALKFQKIFPPFIQQNQPPLQFISNTHQESLFRSSQASKTSKKSIHPVIYQQNLYQNQQNFQDFAKLRNEQSQNKINSTVSLN